MTKPQEEMIFKSVNGLWVRVDSRDPKPRTLAETLEELQYGKSIHYNLQYVHIR